LIVLLIIVILVLINALYVAAEFATISTRRSRVQQLAEEGNALAKKLVVLLKDPQSLDRYVATCQIGITASSLILGAYGQANLAEALMPLLSDFGGLQVAAAQSISAVVVLVLLTVFQMILGELVPKSLALQFPTSLSLICYVPVSFSTKLFKPFIWLTNGSAFVLLRLFGVRRISHGHVHSAEELGVLFSDSREGGALSEVQNERLRTALKLSRLPVCQLMCPRSDVAGIDSSTSVNDALERFKNSPFTRLVAYEGDLDGAIGMLHSKDVLRAKLDGRGNSSVRPMVRPAAFVPASLSASDLLKVLKEFRSNQAFVLDEHGGLEGLITLEDVLAAVFGSIEDEFKARELQFHSESSSELILPGRTRLFQLEHLTGQVESPHAVTIGGFVSEHLPHEPRVGDEVIVGACKAIVDRIEEGAITQVKLVRLENPTDG
jgi:CBS domain containing-hemolysin-like protein